MDVPQAWEQLSIERLRGVALVIGATDVGKSTFCRYVYARLCATLHCVGYLDGDPGQSTLGPPTTITLALGGQECARFPPSGPQWRSFVGAVSPSGHMLALLVGAARLVRAAQEAGAEAIVYDTTGLVDPACGGLDLKRAKIGLLRPTVVYALQRGRELEPLLVPLRRSGRVRVVDVARSRAARRRHVQERRAHRARQYAAYLAGCDLLEVDWGQIAVFPAPRFFPGRLVSLEDAAGYTRGLGVVVAHDEQARRVTLRTPLRSLDGIDAVCLGDVCVDLETYQDARLALGEVNG